MSSSFSLKVLKLLSLPKFDCPFTERGDDDDGGDDTEEDDKELGAAVVEVLAMGMKGGNGDVDDVRVKDIPKSLLNIFIKLPPEVVKRLCAMFFS